MRREFALLHSADIERAFLFGEKGETTVSSKAKRYTGGILEFIESGGSYIQDQDGPITRTDLGLFLREGFTYGSGQKMLFCGGILLNAISEIAAGQLQTKMGDSSYGVAIKQWIAPQGIVNIVQHPMLINDYAGYGFLLDMNSFRYRYAKGRDTSLRTNIQANDVDGEVDEYLTECGLERKLAANCALIKGITD